MEGRKFVNGPLILNVDGSFQSPENQTSIPNSNLNDLPQQIQSPLMLVLVVEVELVPL